MKGEAMYFDDMIARARDLPGPMDHKRARPIPDEILRMLQPTPEAIKADAEKRRANLAPFTKRARVTLGAALVARIEARECR